VIHAHPPYAVALSLAGMDLTEPLLPEVVMALGSVPVTRFAAPSSPEGGEVAGELIGRYSALILDRHGAVTVGSSLRDALWRMERLEFAAQVVLTARMSGTVKRLTPDEILRIEASAKKYRERL